MSGKLDGKIALITGGSTGIGLATAIRFVAEGAYVFITGRRQVELDHAVKEIGTNVAAIQGDVAKMADIDRMIATIKSSKGRIDTIFANAGSGEFMVLGEITEEHFDNTFNSNVKGVLFTVQKAMPILSDGASIILNASIAGSTGNPAVSVYSATKAALRSFARTWTVDLKSRRIRVNAISPGPIDTPGLTNLALTGGSVDEIKGLFVARVPLGRIGQPDEVAKAAVFLASDDSSYVTGIELFVDGGAAQV